MNVVTANENRAIIDKLSIDIIKRVDGVYDLKELLSKFINLYFNKMIIDITSIKNYKNEEVFISLAKVVDTSRIVLLLNDDPYVNSPEFISMLVKNGFYNFTRNYEGLDYLIKNPNTLDDVKNLIIDENKTEIENASTVSDVSSEPNSSRQVIGFINLTKCSGASTLVSMCTRQMNSHGKTAIGIEMLKQDLLFYRDPNIFQCMSKPELEKKLKVYDGVDAVFIDLNDLSSTSEVCDKIIYLIEPSFIELTKLLKRNKNIFIDKKGEYIVLNKSFIDDNDLKEFEYDFKTKIFANIPPLDDRNKDLYEINEFLKKLGFNLES